MNSRAKLAVSTFAIIASHLVSYQPVSAQYIHIEAPEVPIPSFDVVGTVPLTQIGTGIPALITGAGAEQLHIALSKLIPPTWNYFISQKVSVCNKVTWAAQKESWVSATERLAKRTNIRVLVDWNFKSVLVLDENEIGADSVFFNPREGLEDAKVIDLTLDDPLQTVDISEDQSALDDCATKTNPVCAN